MPETAKHNEIFSTGLLLLLMICITIFVVPVFPGDILQYLYPIFITGMFVVAALSLQKKRTLLIRLALGITVAIWISFFGNLPLLSIISRGLQFLFFLFLVTAIIRQVASSKEVGHKAIVDAITGYLLLGFALGTMVMLLSVAVPNAFNLSFEIDPLNTSREPVRDFMYYTFITYTTTGYGDIVPKHPAAKSLAILIGVSGQLYVATILAMLVGKYSANNK